MDLPSYFGPKLTGGANSSAGLAYQDLCGLTCLFELLNRNQDVLSISVETINDFVIHKSDQTITAQVKKQTLSISDIKQILQQTYSDNKHTVMIVASHFHEDLDKLIKRRDQFRYVMSSDFDDTWKHSIIQNFHDDLIKYGMNDMGELFLKSEFQMIPERMAEMALMATAWKWIEKQECPINISQFLDSLKAKMQSLRCDRGHLNLMEINELMHKYSTQSLATQVIKRAYEAQFVTPSQVLSVLGDTKDEILKELEEKLLAAQDLFEQGKHSESLDIYLSLVKLYPKEDIQLRCAMIYAIKNNYTNSIDYCEKILSKNPIHYAANLIKGTNLSELKRYTEAITQLKKALSCKNTPEAHYNLAHTYWLASKNREKSIYHYKACLELDENFINAHLNISICYFEVMSYELSLFHVNRALEMDSGLHQAYSHKGELYRFLGLYDDAIEYFEECLTHNEQNYQALFGISLCFAEKGYLSEAIIYFSLLFKYHYQKFFRPEGTNAAAKKIKIVDIGWKRTLGLTFELYKDNQVNIFINGTTLPVTLKQINETIFVGCSELSTGNNSILYPSVGKFFEDTEGYNLVLSEIQKNVDLFQYFHEPIYVDYNQDILINVQEREKYVLIEMKFGERYQIVGMTDSKSGGLEAFVDYFKEYGQCRIHLECFNTQEVFIIDGIQKVKIELLF